jgi:hypothetical protein
MEQFQVAAEQARKSIKVADHMLIMTFPMVKDPKILLSVTENIFAALTNSMSSLVYYERLFKRVPVFQEDFDSKFNIFKAHLVGRYNISREYLNIIQEIREILAEHRKSPVEFSRGDRFVICSSNYRLKTIGVLELKRYIAQTKMFMSDMERLVNKNAGIFK